MGGIRLYVPEHCLSALRWAHTCGPDDDEDRIAVVIA